MQTRINIIYGEGHVPDSCTIGNFNDIGSRVGERSKIQSFVSIPPGWQLGTEVFYGPGCRFANDKRPDLKAEFIPQGGVVESGAVIGMGALIGAGVRIGKNAVIGMGAVVLRDVEAGTTVFGNPAKVHYSYECEWCKKKFLSRDKRGVRFCSRSCYYIVYTDPKKREDFGFIPKDNDIIVKYKQYQANCVKRNMEFGLSFDEFKSFWNKPCHYCDERIESIGLDRVDNSIGYKKENVVPCCWDCNRLKGNMEMVSFMDKIKKIYHKHGD